MSYKSNYKASEIDNLLDSVNDLRDERVKDYELYGYRKCINDPNPFTRIEYIEDNKDFRPASMNYNTGKFDYGDWAGAFFMQVKPVMLRYDGTIAEYLNPNDYTKRTDGLNSNNKNLEFEGNCMIQFPKIYVKRKTAGSYEYVWISNKQIDSDFHCWSNYDAKGNEIDYFYYSAYEGVILSNVLRSMSGFAPTGDTNVAQEIQCVTANNKDRNQIWYTNIVADWMLICDLLRLISKNSNVQKTFGTGNCGIDSNVGSDASSLINTGTMDNKGLFWGSNNCLDGVKVFGIENFWGNRWDRIAGWIYKPTGHFVKMTWNKNDGSKVIGYNTDGAGYISIKNSIITGTSRTYITKGITNDYGYFYTTLGGTTETYECDGGVYNEKGINYALVGGCSNSRYSAGLMVNTDANYTNTSWNVGASPSCKPYLRNIKKNSDNIIDN